MPQAQRRQWTACTSTASARPRDHGRCRCIAAEQIARRASTCCATRRPCLVCVRTAVSRGRRTRGRVRRASIPPRAPTGSRCGAAARPQQAPHASQRCRNERQRQRARARRPTRQAVPGRILCPSCRVHPFLPPHPQRCYDCGGGGVGTAVCWCRLLLQVCMGVYGCGCAHTHTHMHACMHARMHAHTNMYAHASMHAHTFA